MNVKSRQLRSVITMEFNTSEHNNMIYVSASDDIDTIKSKFESYNLISPSFYSAPCYTHEPVSFDITGLVGLKEKIETLLDNVNTVLLKLQECARQEGLVDETGSPLDEFIETFVVH